MSTPPSPPFEFTPGHYYSNGGYGRSWGVRLVTGYIQDAESGEVAVTFKGIAGTCRRKQGHCSVGAFRRWARYQVALNENSWLRVGQTERDDS